MLKIIGACLIVIGAGSAGIGKAVRFFREMQQLRDISAALELLKCEMNYTMLPVAKVCRLSAAGVHGGVNSFLLTYAQALEDNFPRTKAAQKAAENLSLPNDAMMAVLELFGSLGRYDLEGENRLLDLTQQRLRTAILRYEKEKKPLAKGYAALGICTGLALAIVLV